MQWVIDSRTDTTRPWCRFTVDPFRSSAEAEDHRQKILKTVDGAQEDQIRVRSLPCLQVKINSSVSTASFAVEHMEIDLENNVLILHLDEAGTVEFSGYDNQGINMLDLLKNQLLQLEEKLR